MAPFHGVAKREPSSSSLIKYFFSSSPPRGGVACSPRAARAGARVGKQLLLQRATRAERAKPDAHLLPPPHHEGRCFASLRYAKRSEAKRSDKRSSAKLWRSSAFRQSFANASLRCEAELIAVATFWLALGKAKAKQRSLPSDASLFF